MLPQTTAGAIVRAPVTPYLQGEDLLWLIEEWFVYLERIADEEAHLSASDKTIDRKTINAYREKVRYFVEWWGATGPSLQWRLTARAFKSFEIYLHGRKGEKTGRPLAYNTRATCIRRLSQFFVWAHENGYTPAANYGFLLPDVQGAPPQRRVATLEELQRVLTAARKSGDPERDAALFVFFVGTGCRRSEVADLCIEDLQFHADGAGLASIRGKKTKANPTGERQIAFDAFTGIHLLRIIGEATTGPVFLSRKGNERLSGSGAYKVIKTLFAAADLPPDIQACHDLRRAFAHHLAKIRPGRTFDHLIQRQLGHTNFAQTIDYMLLDAADLLPHVVNPLDIETTTT